MNETTSMPSPVKYYVGDLCYVMSDAEWEEVCASTPFDNSEIEFELSDGRKYILFSTAFGDGVYNDQNGRRYPVDSGTIGAIKADDVSDVSKLENAFEHQLGQLHEFPAEIDEMDCYYSDGMIGIYSVNIDTGSWDCDEDEEYNDEE